MKKGLNIFEKISLTLAVLNVILFIAGFIVGILFSEDIGLILVLPIAIQLVVEGLLFIIIDVVLCKIWGLEVHLFPSLYVEY